jgi:molybdate transport system substrate-binding protein
MCSQSTLAKGPWLATGLLGMLVALASCSAPADPALEASRPVRVAAASDLKFAMDELLAEFALVAPSVRAEVTFGSSGNFYAQLMNRAPFDVYCSADVAYPDKLVEQGVAPKDARFDYAVGHIVVWTRGDNTLDFDARGLEALTDPSVVKIAIANPEHAPYGRAAMAALASTGVLEQVREKLVNGENVAQTAQFVEQGAADVGIISLSLALAPALRHKGRMWRVPDEAYPRMLQGGVVLPWASDPAAAAEFRAFMTSSEAQAILARFGFQSPAP